MWERDLSKTENEFLKGEILESAIFPVSLRNNKMAHRNQLQGEALDELLAQRYDQTFPEDEGLLGLEGGGEAEDMDGDNDETFGSGPLPGEDSACRCISTDSRRIE